MRPWVVGAMMVFLSGLSGCVESPPPRVDPIEEAPPVVVPGSAWVATDPVVVNPDGWGFEPSIRVAPDGAIYVAAARGVLPRPDGGLASPVWVSRDDGSTWAPLETPADIRDRAETQEGDLAVDADGRVYFHDTFGSDGWLTTWGPDGSWESTLPVATPGADDRPWLASDGPGSLALLGNSVASVPLPGEPASAGAIGFYRSDDGGQTWSLGRSLDGATACGITAPEDRPGSLWVACLREEQRLGVIAPTGDAVVFGTQDGGALWTSTSLAPLGGLAAGFPSAAIDGDRVVAAWGETPAGIRLAWTEGAGWNVTGLDHGGGPVENVWVCAGGGTVGVVFEVQEQGSWWAGYGVATDPDSDWTWGRLDPDPVKTGDHAPADFFQCAVDGRGRLHAAYHVPDGSSIQVPPVDLRSGGGEVRYVRVSPTS